MSLKDCRYARLTSGARDGPGFTTGGHLSKVHAGLGLKKGRMLSGEGQRPATNAVNPYGIRKWKLLPVPGCNSLVCPRTLSSPSQTPTVVPWRG
jgi:hypothetical protein